MLPKTANSIRRRKSWSKKQRRSSSQRLQSRHRESRRRPTQHRRCNITVLFQLHLSSSRCLSDSSEHALPNVHLEVPTPVCPPNIAAAKAACRGIIFLARQSSL